MFSATHVLELIYLFFIDILILVGNSLVILAFISGPPSLRTYTNYFVLNLAVSDLLVGCVSLPFWICARLGECHAFVILRMFSRVYNTSNLNTPPPLHSLIVFWFYPNTRILLGFVILLSTIKCCTCTFLILFSSTRSL